MSSLRPADKLVKRSLDLLKGDFVMVGKRRVSLFTLSLIGMFMVGAIVAFGFLASRSGTLQGGWAATVPSCSGTSGPASDAEGLGLVNFYANGVQNATSVQFAVWTDTGGQDDLVWYPGIYLGDSSGGTWKGVVDLSKHLDEGIMNVHVWMFDGSSRALCGGRTLTKPSGKFFQLSKDFSSVNGQRGWHYPGTYYTENTQPQCGPDACWHTSKDFEIIKKYSLHPDNGPVDPAVAFSWEPLTFSWKAPSGGFARITGTVRDICSGSGDGISVEIRHRRSNQDASQIIWSQQLADGNTVGASFDKNVTFANDPGDLYFKLSPLANNFCDWTEFDPKIEFTPTALGGGRVSVKEVFLPGVSASPVMLLDGVPPEGQPGKRYWENVSPGTHVLSVSGVPKVFYAACPDASECLSAPSEGASISFNHQFGKSDTIRLYFGSATSEIVDAYALLSATPLRADSYDLYNLSIMANNCKVDLYTDATGDYFTWAQQVATIWSATGVKINIIPDGIKGSQVKINYADSTGDNDQISAMRIGAFDIIYDSTGTKVGGWTPYGRTIFYNYNKPEAGATGFYPDIAIDIRDQSWPSHPVAMKSTIAHEIGHLLGLDHNVDTGSVMYGISRSYVLPSSADIEAVKAKYPQCAPKPAKVSISFSPNPAVWMDKSGGTGKSSCRDGKMIVPNSEWSTNLDVEETGGSSGATMDKVVIKEYDTSGMLKVTDTFDNFYGGLKVKAGSIKAVSFYVYPRAKFALGKITLKLSGRDDIGNTIETSEKTLSLKTPPKGKEKITECKKGDPEPWPILGSGPVPVPQ